MLPRCTALTRSLAGWWFSFGRGAARNAELLDLSPYSYERFLQSCRDPRFPSWTTIDASQVFPDPPGTVEARGRGLPHGYADTKAAIVAGIKDPESLPDFTAALQGVERLRQSGFEDWMRRNQLDAVVFPANADVGRADADVNESSYEAANRNGVRFSNMNHAIRHLGIPSVSVAMGLMSDIGMPVNLTFVGPAYSDNRLLSYAYAYEQATHNRVAPGRVPPLSDETIEYQVDAQTPPAKRRDKKPPSVSAAVTATRVDSGQGAFVRLSGTASDASGLASVRVYVGGHRVSAEGTTRWRAEVPVTQLSEWGLTDIAHVPLLVLARDRAGNAGARLRPLDLSALVHPRVSARNIP